MSEEIKKPEASEVKLDLPDGLNQKVFEQIIAQINELRVRVLRLLPAAALSGLLFLPASGEAVQTSPPQPQLDVPKYQAQPVPAENQQRYDELNAALDKASTTPKER